MKKISITDSVARTVKKRLLSEKKEFLTWRAVADKYHVNVSYIYNFVKHGIVPGNNAILEVLGFLDVPNTKLDYTRSRRERLDEIAQGWGYASWCNYESSTIEKEQKCQNIIP
jgi:hypothetical protein